MLEKDVASIASSDQILPQRPQAEILRIGQNIEYVRIPLELCTRQDILDISTHIHNELEDKVMEQEYGLGKSDDVEDIMRILFTKNALLLFAITKTIPYEVVGYLTALPGRKYHIRKDEIAFADGTYGRLPGKHTDYIQSIGRLPQLPSTGESLKNQQIGEGLLKTYFQLRFDKETRFNSLAFFALVRRDEKDPTNEKVPMLQLFYRVPWLHFEELEATGKASKGLISAKRTIPAYYVYIDLAERVKNGLVIDERA